MGRRKKTRTICLFGRLHYDGYNWYSVVAVIVNGEFVGYTDYESGGGEYYIQAATEWLEKNGYLPGIIRHSYGGLEALWVYADRVGIPKPYCTKAEVRSKKALHQF